jgi:predicted permease
MQIPLRAGRFLSDQDTHQAPPVCVINQSMANRYFRNEDPLGKKVRLGINDFTAEIVGVVRDVRQRSLSFENLTPEVQKLFSSQVYIAYGQRALWPRMRVIVRTFSEPTAVVSALRAEVRALDKDLPISKLRTMDAVRGNSIAQPRFRTLLIGLFSALALVLAAIGIYAVIAYTVTQRAREIGIRMALGAQRADILKLIVKQGLPLIFCGLLIGLAGAFALTRFMASLLYGVTPSDPATFLAVAFLLTAVALIACLIPARRAASVDPMVALRHE